MWTIRNVLIIRKHGSSSTHRLFGQWHGETRCYKCLVLLPNQSDSVVLKGISLISQGQHPSQDASGNMEKWWRWGSIFCCYAAQWYFTLIDTAAARIFTVHKFCSEVGESRGELNCCDGSVRWNMMQRFPPELYQPLLHHYIRTGAQRETAGAENISKSQMQDYFEVFDTVDVD